MTDRRRVTVGVGLLAALGGLVLLVAPAVGERAVPALGAVAVIILIGVVGLGLAVRQVFAIDTARFVLPTPETRPGYRQPGSEVTDLLASVSLVGRRKLDAAEDTPRERLRARLHALAVDVLGDTDGWPPATAAERLADGTWTDDGQAGAFFAEELDPPIPRFASFRDIELPVVRRARRVLTVLADRYGETVPTELAATANPATIPATDPYWPTGPFPRVESTGVVNALTAAILGVSAVGVWFGRPGAVLATTLGLSVLGAARLWSPPATVSLSRSLSTDSPAAGDRVTVTVTVRNTGETTLPDIRLVDGVPPGLTVVDGSPRFTTALRPGKARTFTYTVAAVPGKHRFKPGLVAVGDGLGTTETITTVEAEEAPTELDCGFDRLATTTDAPRPTVTVDPGQHVGDATGSGVEFDAVREYRPGDPPASIDWHHWAKTGVLSTVEFCEPRRSRVVIVVDTRRDAYVTADDDGIPAPRHGAEMGSLLASQLLTEGVPVGLATTSPSAGWLPPATGSKHRVTLQEQFATADTIPWVAPDENPDVADVVAGLTARLDPGVQVVFVSPCCDDAAIEIARGLDVEGHSVTVSSPDCTGAETVAGIYGRLTRRQRLATLRAAAIPVRDWQPAAPSPEGGCRD